MTFAVKAISNMASRALSASSLFSNAKLTIGLLSRHDDFSELDAADLDEFDISDIPWVIPANDNVPTKVRLRARYGALLRRLIVAHSLR
jgi:hypothetical protein